MVGMIRKKETDKVPLNKPIWFLVLSKNEEQLEEEIYQTSKTDIKILLERLQNKEAPLKIYAIWNGNWNTDLFDMNKDILIQMLIKETKSWKKI